MWNPIDLRFFTADDDDEISEDDDNQDDDDLLQEHHPDVSDDMFVHMEDGVLANLFLENDNDDQLVDIAVQPGKRVDVAGN